MKIFDSRSTLSRSEVRSVYDKFAETNHTAGKDASSGYGGPAIQALLAMASLSNATKILDYGCGQGKLAELVFQSSSSRNNSTFAWFGVDQSPKMVKKAKERLSKFNDNKHDVFLLPDGEPTAILTDRISFKNVLQPPKSVDRFISTYCLDLLSEEDIYKVLNVAETVLHPSEGILILVGITWGYGIQSKGTIKTFFMTLIWEIMYLFFTKKVGGCRPQNLEPYLKECGWTIVDRKKTLPQGFPWMVSEVIAARPPKC